MSRQFFAIVVCAVVAMTGCNRSQFKLVPVSGVVTMDGQPLEGAVVSFQPIATEGDNSGPGSSGRTDASGKFSLATQAKEPEPGAVVAQHKVRISMGGGDTPPPDDSDEDVEPVFEGIPMRYNLKSELKFVVPADGSDQANFDLKSR